ncbi:MAG TPA: DUF402 domain-containing protein [Ktedonobacteraceae bacterium]|nr:DUF402 domain-containing protein [Ktedonobacteraceae bacterium]
MQQDFLVESRSYDGTLRGSWLAYKLDHERQLGDEQRAETANAQRVWLPAGTPMRWASGVRPLRSNCLQFFWPQRWYMLSAFYNEQALIHTYASIIQPATIQFDRVAYVDLDLSILVKPDLSYEVLTQAEFEQMAELLHYDEETRISALMALRTVTSSIQLSLGLFAQVPHNLKQTDFHLAHCSNRQ